FELSEEHRAIRNLAREFARNEVAPVAPEREKIPNPEDRTPWDLIEKASRLGLRTLPYPTEYGGGGADVLACCIAGEELAAGDLGFAVIFDQTWKLAHILEEALGRAQREEWLPRLCRDHRFVTAIALTEPGCGSDHQGYYDDPSVALLTAARREGREWVLRGQKHFISNGSTASLYIVGARTDLSKTLRQSLSGFLVPRQTPGFRVGRVHEKIGQRLVMNAELLFEGARLPEEALLLGEGKMMGEIRGRLLACGKPEAAATALGVGRAAYEAALAHARERVQGGRPIVEHQAIAMMLADMAIGIDLARTHIHKTAWAVDHMRPYDFTLGWKCKVFASEVAFECARKAMEIHGGAGIMQELPVEKYLRDASTFLHSDGTNQMLRLRISRAAQETPFAF
ncbi:MAG: acyl-CoA dehydrogenase family protein, partial [Nitrospinota bacterium]